MTAAGCRMSPCLNGWSPKSWRATPNPFAPEGWKWVETAIDFPYGHTYGLRHLQGERQPLSEEEAATRESLRLEADQLEAAYSEADEIPEEVDARLGEIETALEAMEDRPVIYAPEDIARAGVFRQH